MKKLVLLALAGLGLGVSGASAHQIWIEQDAKTARLYFGEYADNLREVSPGTLDKIPGPTVTLVGKSGETILEAARGTDAFALKQRAKAGESIIAEENSYPLFDRKEGETTSKGMWVPAARYVTDLSPRPAKLTLDIVPAGQAKDGTAAFVVSYKGAPLPKTKATIIAPSGWAREARTDESGKIEAALPWKGTYVVEVHHNDRTPGKRGQEEYAAASYVTSLSFTTAKGAASPSLPAPAKAN